MVNKWNKPLHMTNCIRVTVGNHLEN